MRSVRATVVALLTGSAAIASAGCKSELTKETAAKLLVATDSTARCTVTFGKRVGSAQVERIGGMTSDACIAKYKSLGIIDSVAVDSTRGYRIEVFTLAGSASVSCRDVGVKALGGVTVENCEVTVPCGRDAFEVKSLKIAGRQATIEYVLRKKATDPELDPNETCTMSRSKRMPDEGMAYATLGDDCDWHIK
jgi:hypothetical protein